MKTGFVSRAISGSVAFALLLSISLGTDVSMAFAATKTPSGVCKPLGTTKVVSGKKYTCVKVSGKLVWNKGSVVPVDVFAKTKLIKPVSAESISVLAIAKFDAYTSVARNPQVVKIEAQPGTSQTWIEWVSKGVGLIADSFEFNKPTEPYVAVLAKDRQWLVETYTRLYGEQEANGRAQAFDAGAPAFGGNVTGTWNLGAIEKNNLEAADPVGMRQTPGHEYFHAVQQNIVGPCGACSIPQWFWEGAAVFVGTAASSKLGFNSYATDGRNFSVNRSIYGPTAKLTLSQVVKNDASTDPYGIGAIATEYLVANVGMDRFLNVYREVGKGRPFSVAFQNATGISLVDFYSAFELSRSTLGVAKTN